ncbi:MAG: 23S rRNA (pseudouridine(1915)-N(3))-methyltransferase RlmH, partial [Clostridia bacterium]|nr:23S rRNA (pseudouridine(1915)-N(3))-methyltransferase RlmH [Clostridia bacterium]
CEVKEENFVKEPSDGEILQILKREGESILKEVKGHVVAMAIEGKKCSSQSLAAMLKTQVDKGQEITFVIGGSYGLSEAVKKSANTLLSFSDATFPHTLFRVMLLEQVYRAFSINADARYHK